MFGAIADAGCVPLARVPAGKHEWIKMVLDCGAMGIVVPMVMDADEARAIVAATKYAPRGNRSVGGGFHAINYGCTAEQYYKHADDEILVVIQTEHIKAVEQADEIYAVPGLNAVFVGPNDLAYSMRSADGTMPSKEVMETHADPHSRSRGSPAASLRPARPHNRRLPAPRQGRLAIHRRRQRAQVHARRRRRSYPSDQSHREPRRPGEVLSRRISLPPPSKETLPTDFSLTIVRGSLTSVISPLWSACPDAGPGRPGALRTPDSTSSLQQGLWPGGCSMSSLFLIPMDGGPAVNPLISKRRPHVGWRRFLPRNGGRCMAMAAAFLAASAGVVVPPIVRQTARIAASEQLKRLGLALDEFQEAHGHFPAAAITDKSGTPLLSWRVAILPQLGYQSLYDAFHLDEPWDSPHNLALAAQMPEVFRCPSLPDSRASFTGYQVVVGPKPELGSIGTMFEWARGVEIREVTDGTSNTVLVAETSRAIPWTQPDDPPFDRDGPLPQFGSGHSGGFHVIFADGAARFIKSSIESQILKSLLTRDGGEVISGDS